MKEVFESQARADPLDQVVLLELLTSSCQQIDDHGRVLYAVLQRLSRNNKAYPHKKDKQHQSSLQSKVVDLGVGESGRGILHALTNLPEEHLQR